MKLILLAALLVAALCADDPITVNPNGGGGLPPQIQGTGLTMDFCIVADTECSGSDLSSKFAPATSECLKRCGRSPDCLSAFYDSKKVCHLRGNRCDAGARDSSPGATYLHRLKDGESCPADTPEYFSTIPKYSNRFCVVEGKACSGHNLYKRPQKIPEFIDCLRKCVGINECAMVDFFDGQCELKNHACTDDELVDTAGTDNYVRLDEATLTCPSNRKVPDETIVPQPEPEPEPEPEPKPEPKPEPEPEPEPEPAPEPTPTTCGEHRGPASGTGNDSPSKVTCPAGQVVYSCRCSLEVCDQVALQDNGQSCVAYNAEGGQTVQAVADCCAPYVAVRSEGIAVNPRVDCPERYQPGVCQWQSFWGNYDQNKQAFVEADCKGCQVRKCGLNCTAHALCFLNNQESN